MNTSDLYTRKSECTGCGLCSFVCPSGIIRMKADEEGFVYPFIAEPSRCISCRKCITACPVKNCHTGRSDFIGYYAGYLQDQDDLTASSSGGMAAVIAREFIFGGGVVYGVSYSPDWHKAVYTRAAAEEEAERFRSSKYIQAEKGDLFQQIDEDLQNGNKVLAFGVPCDIAALKQRFGRYASLYTAEIVCHGPTSQKVFDEYCARLERDAGAELVFFSCRHKDGGNWKPYYNLAKFANGREFKETFQSSDYGVAFQCFKRPSCNRCVFKDSRLQGDLMLGDYHYAQPGMSAYNKSGVSVILPHTEKGTALIPFHSDQVRIFPVSRESALMNRAIHEAIPARRTRSLFFRKWNAGGLHSACSMRILSVERAYIRWRNKIGHAIKKAGSVIKKR